jgi:hypothetical protein
MVMTMSEGTPFKDMPADEQAIWKRATASDYVKFDNGLVDVQFVNGKVAVKPGIGGKESYEFDVILTTELGKEAKILGTQAKGLMEQLLSFYPLAEKRFSILRSGEGFQTTYDVQEL